MKMTLSLLQHMKTQTGTCFRMIRKSAECYYKCHKLSGYMFKARESHISTTCSVFPGYRSD